MSAMRSLQDKWHYCFPILMLLVLTFGVGDWHLMALSASTEYTMPWSPL